jgi:pimeloyl-ACP methyl ester carboxylesterase
MSTPEIAAVQWKNLSLLMLRDPTAIDPTAVALQIRSTRLARMKSIGFFPPEWIGEQLSRVHAPIGAIWGEFDAAGYPHIDERKQALRAVQPHAPFHVVPGSGHWVQYETPHVFNSLLLERLASLPREN